MTSNVLNLYFGACIAERLKCKLSAPSDAQKILDDGIRNGGTTEIIHQAVAALTKFNLKGAQLTAMTLISLHTNPDPQR